MDLRIRGKKALVLGASRGLGLGVANALAAEGVEVMLCGRSSDVLESHVKDIRQRHGVEAHFLPGNLADKAFAQMVADHAARVMGTVDILVNNSGGPAPGKATDITADVLSTQAQMMLFSIIELSNLLVPAMRQAQWGRILTIASSGVVQPIPNLALSNTLRSAIVGWNKTFASEVANDGVTCNLIVPGRIHTSRVDQLDEAAATRKGVAVDAVRGESMASIPAGRYGTVEEFSDLAAFLCSDRASYTTGSIFRCDGGAIRSI